MLTTREAPTFASLAVADFRSLWLGVLTAMAGMQMQVVARGYLVYDITSSPLLLGITSAGYAVPMLLLSLFGGAAADRLRRKGVIQICQAVSGMASLGIAIFIACDAVTWVHLFIASAVQGVVFAFMVPSRTSLIPHLVGPELVTNALALNAAAMSSMTLLAPAMAGWLYTLLGPAGVYFVIVALQLLAVVFTGCIRQKEHRRTDRTRRVLPDIAQGLGYAARKPLVGVLLVLGLLAALLAMPFRTLLPIFVVDLFDRGPEALGLLMSFMGGGAILGSLTIASLGRRSRGLILILGGILSGLALLAVSVRPTCVATACAMFVLGLGDAARRALNMALILEVVDEEFRGRMSSIYTMNFGLMPLGVLPASAIAEFSGPRAATLFLAVLLLAVFVPVLVFHHRLRRMA